MVPQGELSERHSVASESGSSTDSHVESPDTRDGELSLTLTLTNVVNIWILYVSTQWFSKFLITFIF